LIGADRYNDLKQRTLDICSLFLGPREVEILSYQDVWFKFTGIPYRYEQDYFMLLLDRAGVDYQITWTTRDLEDLAFSILCQPHLGKNKFTLIDGFPVEQAALARIEDALAKRFELFIDGFELANGYDELVSPEQNLERFEQWHRERAEQDLLNWKTDHKFIQALPTLPACAGVALGLERLLMLALNKKNLDESMVFSWNKL
jgi:lysyl-tRNA synthetase class 2